MGGGGGVRGGYEPSSIFPTGCCCFRHFFCSCDFECEVTELDVSGGVDWGGGDGREHDDECVAASEGAGGGDV